MYRTGRHSVHCATMVRSINRSDLRLESSLLGFSVVPARAVHHVCSRCLVAGSCSCVAGGGWRAAGVHPTMCCIWHPCRIQSIQAVYFERLRQLVGEEQGQLLWRGRLAAVHSGRLTDERDDLLIYEFGNRWRSGPDADQLRRTGISPIRHPRAAWQHADLRPRWHRMRRCWCGCCICVRESQNSDERRSGPANLDPVVQTALRFDGQAVWSAPIDPIAGRCELELPGDAGVSGSGLRCQAGSRIPPQSTEFALARKISDVADTAGIQRSSVERGRAKWRGEMEQSDAAKFIEFAEIGLVRASITVNEPNSGSGRR